MAQNNCMFPGCFPETPPIQYVCVDIHTVAAGETLYSISNQYNVPVPILMQVNKILNPYNLLVGQKLCIPGKAPEEEEEGEGEAMEETPTTEVPETPEITTPVSPAPMPTPTTPVTPPNGETCDGMMYTIAPQDTLYMIAKKHKVTLDAIIKANPKLDPYNLTVGMRICIPKMDENKENNNNNNNTSKNNINSNNINIMNYNTQKGDTLARILDRFGVTYESLKKTNPNVNFSDSLENLTIKIHMGK
ncbi:LysM peptidoglycan-binding domain-containing protein [Anaerovorax odorimutans]|uniref:LysM peptidoglycan-binding domain-containing protein n=1 Tax=Anaerovorax odorimutans TaxID=109327 RepID=UPI00041265BF|nr:LysM peptidoglycan-binding domain-containing protein [Anaerovorax odorimutans]